SCFFVVVYVVHVVHFFVCLSSSFLSVVICFFFCKHNTAYDLSSFLVGSEICISDRTTIAPPATTSHGRLSPEDRARAGIGDSLIRVAVGLEDLDDLKADMARGLAAL
ncbi:PLP-dependent transferase, partial [Pseudomonas aeruginosa]